MVYPRGAVNSVTQGYLGSRFEIDKTHTERDDILYGYDEPKSGTVYPVLSWLKSGTFPLQ